MNSGITIDRWQFPTKAAAEVHVRDILARYDHRQQLAGEDLEFAQALLSLHPNRNVIVDCGVKRIEVEHLTIGRRFLVVRTDSSIRDFTWRHALYPRDARQSVLRACRVAVEDQIKAYRARQFSTAEQQYCPLRGTPIIAKTSHVDHRPPDTFQALVDRWLQANRMDYADVELKESSGYEVPTRIADVFLEDNWKEFHQEYAVLRVLSVKANLSDSKKEARRAA